MSELEPQPSAAELLSDEWMREVDELKAKLSALEKRAEELKKECDDLQRTFDLRWSADMRGIKMWQGAEPGRELTWPNHADLTVWLLDRLAAVTAERDSSQASLLRVEKALAHVEQWLTAWAAPPEDKPDRDSWIRGRNRILEVARTALSPHTEK